MNAEQLTGRTRTHLVDLPQLDCALHTLVAVPFSNLRRAALADGIDIVPVSAFRDFTRQLRIWNEKHRGERPLYGADGELLDAAALAPAARIEAILRWTALPGASRHHWGTDLDLIDRNAIPAAAPVSLSPSEYAKGGPYAGLCSWLERHAAVYGFFRPYRGVLSGVQAEPWHYSFAPVAEGARRALTLGTLRETLAAAPLLGKEIVLARLEDLHSRFVLAVDLM